MKTELINQILDNFKGVERNRLLKIALGEVEKGDEEFKKFIFNAIVRSRRYIIKNYKSIYELWDYKKIHKANYKYFESTGDVVNASETYLKIAGIDELVGSYRKSIAARGAVIMELLRFDILSEHEACQLFNINQKTWEDKKARYIKLFGKEEQLVYKLISISGCEYRDMKGRAKEFYDCPDYEMPAYWAMHEHIMQEMRDNKEFHDATSKAFKELFPEIKPYKAIKDLEGNIISVVEDKEEE